LREVGIVNGSNDGEHSVGPKSRYAGRRSDISNEGKGEEEMLDEVAEDGHLPGRELIFGVVDEAAGSAVSSRAEPGRRANALVVAIALTLADVSVEIREGVQLGGLVGDLDADEGTQEVPGLLRGKVDLLARPR
jgi:hypothetical protein